MFTIRSITLKTIDTKINNIWSKIERINFILIYGLKYFFFFCDTFSETPETTNWVIFLANDNYITDNLMKIVIIIVTVLSSTVFCELASNN